MILSGAMTDFSVGKSVIKPKELAENASELGYKALAVADDYSINGLPDLASACDRFGVKLVIGATVRVVDSLEDDLKGPFFEPKVFVRNKQGFSDLTELLTLANDPETALKQRSMVVPRVTLGQLIDCAIKGNVVIGTGSVFSLFAHKHWESILTELYSALPGASLALELLPVGTLYYQRVTANALRVLSGQTGPPQERPRLHCLSHQGGQHLRQKAGHHAQTHGRQKSGR